VTSFVLVRRRSEWAGQSGLCVIATEMRDREANSCNANGMRCDGTM